MIGVDYGVLNQKGSPSWFSDIYANIPTAGYKGRMFISIDTYAFYRDTGTGWDLIGGPGTGTITGSGTSGQVSYFNGSSTLAGSNNLFWDITNSRLGIGTATPGVSLDIHSTGTNAQFNGTGTNNAYLVFQNAGTSKWRIGNTYNAGANSFDIYNNGLANTPLSINSATNLITLSANVTTTGIQAIQNGLNLGYASGGATASYTNMSGSTTGINFALANGTGGASFIFQTAAGYNYTFPATTGTIALTSNLSSYLPLAGGSLTGNLITNSYISIQNGLGTNQIYLTKSSGDVYGTIQTEAGGNKFSLGNVSNIGTLGTPNITWTSGAYVGINNSSPSYELDVKGQLSISNTYALNPLIRLASTTSGNVEVQLRTATTTYNPSIGVVTSGYDFSLFTNNTTRMLISSNGLVGIGTTNPQVPLHVVSSSSARLDVGTTDSYSTSKTIYIAQSTNYGELQSYNYGAGIGMPLSIQPNGGNVLIGTSTDAGTSNLQVQQTANSGYGGIRLANTLGNWWTSVVAGNTNYYFNYQGSGVGYINSSTGAYIPISDINKKKDFEISTIGLNEILGLKPTLYRMKNDNQLKPKQLGFIAQEVKDFIPQAYIESINEEDTFIGLNQMPIIAALVKSIQELNAILVKNNIN